MDFAQHGAWSGLATISPFIIFGVTNLAILLPIFVLAWILGALPDIMGKIGRALTCENIPRHYLYDEAHQFRGFFRYMKYVLPYWLHMGIDKYWHKPDGNWKPWGHWGDGLGWVLFIAIVAGLIFLMSITKIILIVFFIAVMYEYIKFLFR